MCLELVNIFCTVFGVIILVCLEFGVGMFMLCFDKFFHAVVTQCVRSQYIYVFYVLGGLQTVVG